MDGKFTLGLPSRRNKDVKDEDSPNEVSVCEIQSKLYTCV